MNNALLSANDAEACTFLKQFIMWLVMPNFRGVSGLY